MGWNEKLLWGNIFENKNKNLKTALGGAISVDGADFIKYFLERKLIDKYETRKLVYKNSNTTKIIDGIKLGVKFELLWLKVREDIIIELKMRMKKNNYAWKKIKGIIITYGSF